MVRFITSDYNTFPPAYGIPNLLTLPGYLILRSRCFPEYLRVPGLTPLSQLL